MPKRLSQATLLLAVLFGAGVALLAARLVRAERQTLATARAAAREGNERQAQAIEARLRRVMPVATGIAADLSWGALKDQDLAARLKADLDTNPDVFELGVAYQPFAKSPRQRLFAPSVGVSAGPFQLEDRYDYTDYDWFKD